MNFRKPYFDINRELLEAIGRNELLDKWLELPEFGIVAEAANELGIDAWVIGGWVRDLLLGRPTTDIDIVTTGGGIRLAEKTASKIDGASLKVYGKFGTALVSAGNVNIEFVGARKESYRHDSRKPIVEDGTLEDDQKRRDFTINALSIGLAGEYRGRFIDPFNGISDLKMGLIRTPLNPDITFSDDPLRMMRAVRFASQLNYVIESATFEAIRRNRNRLKIVSMERISEELNKIMLSKRPSVGFKLLDKSGILPIILPELAALKGVEEVDGQRHKENFYHTLEVVDNISEVTDNLWLRYAALFHDIGKAPTRRFEKGKGYTFHGHEAVGSKMIRKIFKRLKLPLDHRLDYVRKLVFLSSRPIALVADHVSDSGVRRLLFDAGEDVDDLLTLCESDITSKNKERVRRYKENFKRVRQKMKDVEERDRLRNFQPPVDGMEIIEMFGLKPGREIGMLKNAVKEAIIEGEIANDRQEALAYLKKKATEMGIAPADSKK